MGVRVELFDEIGMPRGYSSDAIGLFKYLISTRDVDAAIYFADESAGNGRFVVFVVVALLGYVAKVDMQRYVLSFGNLIGCFETESVESATENQVVFFVLCSF